MSETPADIVLEGAIVYGNPDLDTLVSWDTSTGFHYYVGDNEGLYEHVASEEIDDIPDNIEGAIAVATEIGERLDKE